MSEVYCKGSIALGTACRRCARCIRELAKPEAPTPPDTAIHANLPKVCDGKEQAAFEAWAVTQGMDMAEHPLHYLFLDMRTATARAAWRAAIDYCRTQVIGSSQQ